MKTLRAWSAAPPAAARVFVLMLACAAGPAHAENPASAPRQDAWVTDLNVYATVATNGVLYLGGDFRYVGPPSGGGVAFDVYSAEQREGMPRVDGAVYAVVPDGRGGRYLGGLFKAVGGVAVTNLVHIRDDRTVDPNWRPSAAGTVFSLAVGDGVIYAGGGFTNVSGLTRLGLAALNATNGTVTAWNPVVPGVDTTANGNYVRTLYYARDARVLVVGGRFTQINSSLRWGIAALLASDGSVTTWDPGAVLNASPGEVFAMVRLDTRLYVAGRFTQIGGLFRSGIAALDVYTGTADLAWAPQANDSVLALAVTCDTVFAGGLFTSIGGVNRNYLAALDPADGLAYWWWDAEIPFEASGNTGVTALATDGYLLHVGGFFSEIGGATRSGIATLDTAFGFATDWNPAAGGSVFTLQVTGNEIYVGGQSIMVGGQRRNRLAAISLDTGRLLPWSPATDGDVYALAISGNTLYAGGKFTAVNQSPRLALAALDAATGALKSWNPTASASVPFFVSALCAGPTHLYAGGSFADYVGGSYAENLAAVDLATGAADPLFDLPAGGIVQDLALSGNTLYVGGDFVYVDQYWRSGLAAIDLTQRAVTTWDPGANSPVLTLEVGGTTVYAGGQFTQVGTSARSGLAAIGTTGTGAVLSWDPSADGPVTELLLLGGQLYAGGGFTTVGGQSRQGLARIDAANAAVSSWNPGASAAPWSMNYSAGQLAVGGSFLLVGNKHRPALAVFPEQGSPVITGQPQKRIVPAASNTGLQVQAAGTGTLTYQWRRNGVDLPGQNSSTFSLLSISPSATGQYDVRITNSVGRVYSDPVPVVAFVPPIVVSQPANQTVAPGATVVFSAQASGEPAPAYQWRRNGVNIPGATQASLTVTNSRAVDAGSYSVVALNVGGAVGSATADLVVSVGNLAASDSFAARGSLTGNTGVGQAANRSATKEPSEPNHAGNPGGRSVWLTWTPTVSGIAELSTRGSGFDTLLAVYRGTTLNALTRVAEDDDSGGYLNSVVKFSAQAGTAYPIAIDGFAADSGNLVVSWQLTQPGNEVPTILQEPQSVTVVRGGNASFTVSASPPGSVAYQWYLNCFPFPRATNATLVITNVQDSDLGAYWVAVGGAAGYVTSQAAYLEIATELNPQTEDKLFDVVPPIQPGDARLLKTRPPRNAPATGYTGSRSFNTFGSTSEPDEPNHCGIPGGASEWFAYQAPAAGTLVIDTDGSDFDTVLAVYTGSGVDYASLALQGCDDDAGLDGQDSRVVLSNVVADAIYFIAVDGVNGTRGTVRLHYSLTAPPAITNHPASQTAARASTVNLTVGSAGSQPLGYQWSLNGAPLPGAVASTLAVTNLQEAREGLYRVVVTNSAGTATSLPAGVYLNDWVRFVNPSLGTNRQMSLRLLGPANHTYQLQGATNWADWTTLLNSNPPSGVIDFSDPQSTNQPYRFYRALRSP